jgi:hypothetical protein
MVQGLSEEVGSCSAGQEILPFLCIPRVHYRVHIRLSLGPILSHMNNYTSSRNFSLRSVLILSSHHWHVYMILYTLDIKEQVIYLTV